MNVRRDQVVGVAALWIAIAGACGASDDGHGSATSFGTSITAGGSPDPGDGSSDGGSSEDDAAQPDPEPASTGDGGADDSTGEPTPSCSNGVVDGDESDVDCGGGCDPCDASAACDGPADCVSGNCTAGACGSAASCLSIKQGRPTAETGTYTIHPDGGAPIDVVCDMDRFGGGWTLTFAADGVTFDVAHAVPDPGPGSVPSLFASSAARYTQYTVHTEEMFVCTTGEGETPLYEVRAFAAIDRFWDASLDNAEIFLTGVQGTTDASATEYCAGLVWGGCNLDHYGYAVFNAAFGTANWGRWSGNTYYGPKGGPLDCFAEGDQTDNPDAWFWHFVR